jgi:hypothetical protein
MKTQKPGKLFFVLAESAKIGIGFFGCVGMVPVPLCVIAVEE